MSRSNYTRMSIAVVIVNFHSENYVERCLSEFSRLGRTDLVCIIVDNSPPGCDDIIENAFPSTTVLPQAENLGFAAGANVGIRYALSKGVEFVC
ncbi:MAG: glycosyltransferase, partial [candidate division Zixibacteria bacterium]